jgi:hypothetical protein
MQNVMDGLQCAFLELEYAVADFESWRADELTNSMRIEELQDHLSQVIKSIRFANSLVEGLTVDA